MNEFQFALHQRVRLTVSGEVAMVIGRAEYAHGENSYFLRYKSTDGRAVEAWWGESALEVA